MSETREAVEFDRGGAVGLRPAPERRLPAPFRAVPERSLGAAVGRALEERRLFVLLPFAIIAGLIAATQVGSAPEPVALVAVAIAIVGAVPLALTRIRLLRAIVLFGAFWCGLGLLEVHARLVGTEMLYRPAYGTYRFQVDEVISDTGSGLRLVASAITPVGDARGLPIRRARIVVAGAEGIAPGDLVTAPVRFYPVPGPVLPGAFDSQFHGFFDGIGAYGATTGTAVLVEPGGGWALSRAIDGLRRTIGTRVDAVMVQPAAGIARSMMIGDQSAITDETREVMAASGLAHIYSISGLHLSIVAGGTLVVLRFLLALGGLGTRLPIKKVAAVAAIAAAFFYLLLAGGSANVPAFRSTLMIALIFGAIVAGRRALTMRNVAIAALVIVLIDPASVFRPSFQLSFAAVVALVGIYELVRRDREEGTGFGSRIGRLVWATAMTSLIAGTATLLFSAYHFQQTAPLGVVANLMSLLLIGPIMLTIVLAVLAMPFGAEWLPLMALQSLIDGLLWIAVTVTEWSGGLTLHPLLLPVALVIGLAALAWFAFLPDRWRLAGPALALPAILLFGFDRPPDVLVADTTQAVAIRTDAGLRLVAGRPGSFAVDVWQETYAETIGAADEAVARCDAVGCIATSPRGFTLALVTDPAGFHEDCAGVDLVVTRRDAPAGCAAPLVIDAEDLRLGGVHWLRWDGAGFEVRPAMVDLNRPWRAARPRPRPGACPRCRRRSRFRRRPV